MATCDINGVCTVPKVDESEKKEDNRVEYKNAKVDPMTRMLGPKLLGQDGEVATSTLKDNDVVGFYFSAHWCPPCRGFTPKFAKTYKELKDAGKKFEVVFLSSDKNQSEFDSYFKEMPWLAVPYSNRRIKKRLSNKFDVSGIPSLILIDPKTGEVTNENGRSAVSDTSKFPWTEPKVSVTDLLKKATFLDKDKEINFDTLTKDQKYLILYFSAHWCPPCRGFTPKFATWYEKNQPALKGKDNSFDVVFVSSDQGQSEFDSYYKEHPWKALKFADRDTKAKLSGACKVNGIPSVIVLDLQGNIVTDEGRKGVMTDEDAKTFPWTKGDEPLVNDVNENPDDLNSYVCMLFPMETMEADKQEKTIKIMTEVADGYKAKVGDDREFGFLYMKSSEANIGSRVRQALKVPAAKDDDAKIYIIDFSEGRYCKITEDPTKDSVQALLDKMVDDYEKKIEWTKLG